MKKKIGVLGAVISSLFIMTACGSEKKEEVVLYSSGYDYENEYYVERLQDEFPEYEITLQYLTTGNHAAKLKAEGTNSEADITIGLESLHLDQMKNNLADLSAYDFTPFMDDMVDDDQKYLPANRNGGSIILNMDLLKEKELEEPTSYEDLLKEEYKGLISMPSPKSSGTGYAFLKSLVNEWGEDEAFEYFDALEKNMQQFTSSGSGPVNSLIQGETAIALGMTSQAVRSINEGMNFKIVFFEEGSPYNPYGSAIIKGKEERESVREVFDFYYTYLIEENNELFHLEQIYKDKEPVMENFPENIQYADMSGYTVEERERLLERWPY